MASWDIFCTVVDNYGDIGVTWRLARQLATDHGQRVRLWVDDLAPFARLCPEADVSLARQSHSGVEVCAWPSPWQATEAADVVIEAFACQLPAAYIQAMRERAVRPLWLNLEYLSAEPWVEDCHGLPSLQACGLQKYFYFPGFQANTGGLLREAGLIERRRAFQADAQAREGFLRSLGIQMRPHERLISLFAYENAAIPVWLDLLEQGARPTLLLVPEGRALGDVARWLGRESLTIGDCHERGALRVQVLPFVRQEEYDLLLWGCDLNAVRGEDSFVRAQWAGRPFIWQIYQQEEEAHLEKLDAFLALYTERMPAELKPALEACWGAWNARGDMGEAWKRLEVLVPQWEKQAMQWSDELAEKTDLAAGLVHFYTNWLSYAP
ncbi:elongation factor P maturation arginine rhamnosyltransferase EarP [Pseudomonas schmalbachii]|uniref:Protein-arginine rhamnosyltransferase n=1 Tax=Pseudomonas schmalbachii TaxID=2816993 RepID=A0ABS3TLU0_9PSED|nr:elongation factor P maturation arginine rhamnosyltransferase EarP [Pseudomonas schmalbachii]MBO3274627.1 elongation factor P maturation arginine rhamnosyltransferase EarP [Pseudomonas schmalbachii]